LIPLGTIGGQVDVPGDGRQAGSGVDVLMALAIVMVVLLALGAAAAAVGADSRESIDEDHVRAI